PVAARTEASTTAVPSTMTPSAATMPSAAATPADAATRPAPPSPAPIIDSSARRAAAAAAVSQASASTEATPRATTSPPRAPSPPTPGPVDNFAAAIKRWFTEGNVPVKVGMLVLIAGVAALLKYASDQGWLRVPIEVRLALIALAAIGALVFGWRQRDRKRAFGLSVQGGAIGVLLMTVFAAFRLYSLLP